MPRRGLETRAGISRAHENADRYGDTFELSAVFEKGDSALAEDIPYRPDKSLLWGYMALLVVGGCVPTLLAPS